MARRRSMRPRIDRRGPRRPALLVPLVTLALFAGAAGCGEGGTEVGTAATAPSTTAPLPPIEGDARQQLEAARTRWATSGVDSYEMTWSWVLFGPRTSGGVEVRDGEVVDGWIQVGGSSGSAQVLTEPDGAEPGQDPAAPTTATIPGTAPGSIPGTTLPPDQSTSTMPPLPPTPKSGDPAASTPPGVPETTIPSGTEATEDLGTDPTGPDDEAPPTDRTAAVLTVEGIFDEIQHALDEGADEVVVDYDPETGRPLRVDIDWMAMAIDDETGLVVDSFTVLDGDGDPDTVTPEPSITGTSLPPEVREVATADLSVHHGCGFGFYVGNPEQTVALHLSWMPDPGPNAGMLARPESEPTPLPGRDWTGELRLGTNLFANWCDDVLEPDEPRPDVTQGWPVVGGTLEMTSDPSPNSGCSGGPPARARVTGLRVEAPDGSIVGLPDLEVENDAWGCMAG